MLGFKLELPRQDVSLKEKTRPIYLDMQVRESHLLELSRVPSWS